MAVRTADEGVIAEVRTEEGNLYLFVAIDRTSKLAYAELCVYADRIFAITFLQALFKAVPYKIRTILTDNCSQFCHAARYHTGPTACCHGISLIDSAAARYRTSPHHQPSLDQRASRAHESNAEGCHGKLYH
jgi:hypothetical protein